ncbi:hypothetical protein FRC01_007762 [Tulasnella sp. 417]|nr:hypothetical protein FRC01_007762 [Tulasnella sp. 417]
MRGSEEPSANTQLFQRVKSFSMTVATPLGGEAVLAALPSTARELTFIVPDATYRNELNMEERRYFIVCPDQATYSAAFNVMRSKEIISQPTIQSDYWKGVTAKIEKGEVFGETPTMQADHLGQSISLLPGFSIAVLNFPSTKARSAEAFIHSPETQIEAQDQLLTATSPPSEGGFRFATASSWRFLTTRAVPPPSKGSVVNRPRRTVYGTARVDTITTFIVKFAQVPLSSLIALHMNKITSTSTPAPGLASPSFDYVGPTGKPSCLHGILNHSGPWTRRAAHSAQKTASQEVKALKREFCEKYQALADRCTNDPQHTLTLDQVMAIVNSIEDRYARRKWMANHIREMRRLNKDVNEMVLEYLALMAHCRKLQKACIAAANEAYDVNIVLIPDPSFPLPTPP